jgi:hypothetical protein
MVTSIPLLFPISLRLLPFCSFALFNNISFLGGGTRICTQGVTLARQAFYHLSHTLSPFLFLVIFQVSFHVFVRDQP